MYIILIIYPLYYNGYHFIYIYTYNIYYRHLHTIYSSWVKGAEKENIPMFNKIKNKYFSNGNKIIYLIFGSECIQPEK